MMGNYHERIVSHARYQEGQTSYYVELTADRAADIPDPAEHPEWEVGSELCILENGGSRYRLSNAREWVRVNFSGGGEGGDVSALQAQIDVLHGDAGETASTLGYTRKNFLQTKPLTFSKHGVTVTVNADGTITLDGTNANSGAFILLTNIRAGGVETAQEFDNYRLLPAGEYILSGGTSDGGAKIQLRLAEEPNSLGDVYYSTPADGGEVRFTVTESQKYSYTKLYIAKGAAFDNVTICPMIRDARISDDTFEPYRQSVEERLAALEAVLSAV